MSLATPTKPVEPLPLPPVDCTAAAAEEEEEEEDVEGSTASSSPVVFEAGDPVLSSTSAAPTKPGLESEPSL